MSKILTNSHRIPTKIKTTGPTCVTGKSSSLHATTPPSVSSHIVTLPATTQTINVLVSKSFASRGVNVCPATTVQLLGERERCRRNTATRTTNLWMSRAHESYIHRLPTNSEGWRHLGVGCLNNHTGRWFHFVSFSGWIWDIKLYFSCTQISYLLYIVQDQHRGHP
jgi:hypothetical protein